MKKHYLFLSLFSILLFTGTAFSQVNVSGKVNETGSGDGLIGVNVIVKGTNQGVSTDVNGMFSIQIESFPVSLEFSYIGYATRELEIHEPNNNIVITLVEDITSLQDILIVGSRFNPRSALSSPVPIDNINANELVNTGQLSIDQMITYKVQSYNASQQTISDATAHFNPADLRGLGPSRTLVLINGKRKNASSLVYINDTPGKGEVGVDMQSIPVEAIERIEILRDGASAQYGSDAIAGVINIILKENVDETNINVYSGITSEGDGLNYGFNANSGIKIFGEGFMNVSIGYKEQEETNRAGSPGEDVLFGVTSADPWIQENPELGMHVGQPNMTTFDVFYNANVPAKKLDGSGNGEIYSFGGLTYRNGLSYALYRAPYWVPDPNFLHHEQGSIYQGFQPTFETDVTDKTFGIGLKSKISDWDIDISSVSGSNTVDYTIGNTLNTSIDANSPSPTRFYAGGYEFRHIVNNVDAFRKYNNFNVGFGGEFRTENFVSIAGEPDSYFGSGAQSFPGIQPSNEVNKTRYNIGFYTDLEYDNDMLLFGGAVRYEKYGDFGKTINWKVNARVRLWEDKLTLRTSANTGFRAPSLHQIYLSNIQTLVSGGTVSNQGTFNNHSPVIQALEVPKLKQEESFNFSGGLAINPIRNLEITADYYSISLNDRVLFTGEIGFDGDNTTTNTVEQILLANNVTSLKFFTNAVDTETRGFDLVASYNNLNIGSGILNVNFAANYNVTEIAGSIKTPDPITASGNEIFNRKEQSRITSSRPQDKFILGLDYSISKFHIGIYNTRFGEVTWRHSNNGLNGLDLGNGPLPSNDEDYDQTFSAKIITDLNLGYDITNKIKFGVTVNNLLNIYPDKINTKGDFVTDLGGRFQYPWEVNQFGFMGTIISGKLNFKF